MDSSDDDDDDFFTGVSSDFDAFSQMQTNAFIESKLEAVSPHKNSTSSKLSKSRFDKDTAISKDIIPRDNDNLAHLSNSDDDSGNDSFTSAKDSTMDQIKRGRPEHTDSDSSSSTSTSSSCSRSRPKSYSRSPKRQQINNDHPDDRYIQFLRKKLIPQDSKKLNPPTNNIIVDENDLFFQELDKNFVSDDTKDSNSSSNNILLTDNENNDSVQSINNNDNNNNKTTLMDPKRIYKIRFISKLEGTVDKTVQVKVLGKFSFDKILPSALDGLVKAYKLPDVMKKLYKKEKVILYRNGSKLLNFMNCNSLNIPQSFPNEVVNVEIVILDKTERLQYENNVADNIGQLDELSFDGISSNGAEPGNSSYLVEDTGNNTEIKNSTLNNKNNQIINSRNVQEETEAQYERELGSKESNVGTNENNNDNNKNTKEEPILRIGLLGEDNKKIFVKVRNSTPFSKLIDYYKIQKQLPQKVKIRLSFDHEDVSPDDCVADYDMDDDDVIDVIMAK